MPGKSHGQRSLVGYSPWGRKEWTQLSDFTFAFTFMTLSLVDAVLKSIACGFNNMCEDVLRGREKKDSMEFVFAEYNILLLSKSFFETALFIVQ